MILVYALGRSGSRVSALVHVVSASQVVRLGNELPPTISDTRRVFSQDRFWLALFGGVSQFPSDFISVRIWYLLPE